MAVSVSPKAGVGGTLRRARRDRGLTLEEVALRTRIHPRHLRALEHDAPPQTFKAPIYARAFLREYAACVGLDPEPLVDAYRTAHHDPPQSLRLLPSPPRPNRKVLKRTGAVAAILALIAGSVTLAFRWQIDLPRPAQPLTAPPAADPAATGGGGGVTYAEGVHLQVRVRDADSLVRIVRNGEVLLDAERPVGWSRTFHAPRKLDVWTRNAGAVVFSLNGERVGTLGDHGERARGRFVWNGQRARLVEG